MTTSEWKSSGKRRCRACREQTVEYSVWESFDGGHEDCHYRCTACAYHWWVDGSDY